MTAIRSLIFNVVFYVNLVLFLVMGSSLFLAPRIWAIRALQLWARTSLWWLKVICGMHMEVRGREHLPQGAGAGGGQAPVLLGDLCHPAAA